MPLSYDEIPLMNSRGDITTVSFGDILIQANTVQSSLKWSPIITFPSLFILDPDIGDWQDAIVVAVLHQYRHYHDERINKLFGGDQYVTSFVDWSPEGMKKWKLTRLFYNKALFKGEECISWWSPDRLGIDYKEIPFVD